MPGTYTILAELFLSPTFFYESEYLEVLRSFMCFCENVEALLATAVEMLCWPAEYE